MLYVRKDPGRLSHWPVKGSHGEGEVKDRSMMRAAIGRLDLEGATVVIQ